MSNSSHHQPDRPRDPPPNSRRRLLITAGPTHEPIDAVRFIGNRSSGRLGVHLSQAAAARGWPVTLLLGPTAIVPEDSSIRLRRFRTAADLEALLAEEFPASPQGFPVDVLIMAAAVADYRPAVSAEQVAAGKLRRTAGPMTLTLEPTPDLLAGCSKRRRPGQLLVGFALEPQERLLASAQDKLARKGLDLIVANPLETMDGESIDATVLSKATANPYRSGRLNKEQFGPWLLDLIEHSAPAG